MVEEWKDIDGYEGLYQISNTGKVKSLKRKYKGGKIKEEQLMAFTHNKDGYYHLQLCKNGIQTTKRVSRLVAIAFIENPNNLPEVNHKDLNRKNNVYTNLEWCTHEDNIKYSYELGRYVGKSGKDNPNYGNKILSKKYKENPELSKEKQSRPAAQNGRARKIGLYDLNWGLIREFTYMGKCCEYLIENYGVKAKVNTIRTHIGASIKKNKSYNGFNFKFLD